MGSPWRLDGATGSALLHYASLPVAFALLLFVGRNQWFFYDEWNFFADRFAPGKSLGLFVPHNEHWSTVPVLVFRAVYGLVQLHSYLPYLAVLLTVHLAVAHLLWRTMRRSRVDPWIATLLVGVFLVLGAGFEDLLWSFQIGFVGSVLFGLAATLLVDRAEASPLRLLAASAGCLLSLMSSGLGVVFTAVVVMVAVLRVGPRRAAAVASIPVLAYVVWYAVEGRPSAFAAHGYTWLLIPDFIWTGLTRTLDASTGLQGAGPLLLVALAVWMMSHIKGVRVDPVPTALALAAPMTFLLIGYGRIGLGVDEAASPRYLYVAAALLLPAAGLALSALSRLRPRVMVAIVVVAGFASVHGLGMLVLNARQLAATKQASKARILVAADLARAHAVVLGTHPDPSVAPQLDFASVAWMADQGVLPVAGPIDPAVRLAVTATLQMTTTGSASLAVGGARLLDLQRGSDAGPSVGGCRAVLPGSDGAFHLLFDRAGAIGFRTDASGDVSVSLHYPGRDQPSSPPLTTTITAGTERFLNISADGVVAVLRLPAGSAVFCGTTT